MTKGYKWIFAVFILLLIPVYLSQRKTEVYYNLDKSIEIVSLEVREPEKPLEKTVEKRYWNRKVEIIVLEREDNY